TQPKYQDQVALPEICTLNAVPLARMIRQRQISATETMAAYLDHIERVNPHCNAIISLRPRGELMAEAAEADATIARGSP
ncbi:hypothetical protein, partial [Escherichia coli]|uniref:hypothetical protein n=1 Tax=Escherichia coli TaxID=562 RepID=UPI00195369E8